jgi:hypothetical protein
MARLNAKTEEALAGELADLREQRRGFLKEHQDRIRDDAHASFEATREEARTAFETSVRVLSAAELVRGVGLHVTPTGGQSETDLAMLWVVGYSSEYAAARHALIDAAEGFSELGRREYEKQVAKLEADVKAHEDELARRGIEARKAELEAELAALGAP